jgi:hypothetical protein
LSLPLPSKPEIVISTEASDSFIVGCAVERPAFAFAVAFLVVILEGDLRLSLLRPCHCLFLPNQKLSSRPKHQTASSSDAQRRDPHLLLPLHFLVVIPEGDLRLSLFRPCHCLFLPNQKLSPRPKHQTASSSDAQRRDPRVSPLTLPLFFPIVIPEGNLLLSVAFAFHPYKKFVFSTEASCHINPVKSLNHANPVPTTTSTWRISFTQTAILATEHKKAPAIAGAFLINTHNPFVWTNLALNPLPGRIYRDD